jgi:hypothetical protein
MYCRFVRTRILIQRVVGTGSCEWASIDIMLRHYSLKPAAAVGKTHPASGPKIAPRSISHRNRIAKVEYIVDCQKFVAQRHMFRQFCAWRVNE